MKISIEKNLVEFTPESEEEALAMTKVWNTVVDCVKFNKKLVPVGEYQPPRTTSARFAVED
ncbi:MAG: hypothetical protein OEY01_04275 [Desulfobulbaceae bacterium]|nr:hypothetical protein [Desulfobulbaceae bacterium]HIJ78400.1 hypothetical protein [Deltaproteobacteria bacterium]